MAKVLRILDPTEIASERFSLARQVKDAVLLLHAGSVSLELSLAVFLRLVLPCYQCICTIWSWGIDAPASLVLLSGRSISTATTLFVHGGRELLSDAMVLAAADEGHYEGHDA